MRRVLAAEPPVVGSVAANPTQGILDLPAVGSRAGYLQPDSLRLLVTHDARPRWATSFAAATQRAFRGIRSVEPSAAVLLAGLAVALLAQGAYYSSAQWAVGLIVLGAVVLAPGVIRLGAADRAIVWVAAVLAGWAIVDGSLHHAASRALPYVVVVAASVALMISCARLPRVSVEWLVNGLLTIGVGIALLGWLGVALHDDRWAFHSDGLWRASSTLGYPNAAASVLVVFALLALAELALRPRSVWLGLAVTLLISGLAATLSRAGLIGFFVGACVLAGCLRPSRVVSSGVAPVLGSVIVSVGVLPMTPALTAPHLVAALGALLAGSCIGVGLPRLRPRSQRASAALIVAVALAVLTLSGSAHKGFRDLVAYRATLESPDRAASNLAAWRLFEAHPWFGVGPGMKQLSVVHSAGGVSTYRYVHDEYLQVLAELGAIGTVLLLALLFLLLRRLYRARTTPGVLAGGVLAGMVALAVHAGFDFIWHFPAIPLLAGVLVGLAVSDPPNGLEHPSRAPLGEESS